MFIIWGTRMMNKTLGYFNQAFQCGRCNNVSNYKLIRQRQWFTLFWIPIFPIGTKYFLGCPVCNYGQYINKKEAKRMLEENQLLPQNQNGTAQ